MTNRELPKFSVGVEDFLMRATKLFAALFVFLTLSLAGCGRIEALRQPVGRASGMTPTAVTPVAATPTPAAPTDVATDVPTTAPATSTPAGAPAPTAAATSR